MKAISLGTESELALSGHLRVLVGGLDHARRCPSCRGVLLHREARLCAECRSAIRVVFDAPDGAA